MWRQPLNRWKLAWFCLTTALLLSRPETALSLTDAESKSHGYDAAQYQIVDVYEFPGFSVFQFNLPVLSHYSYALTSDQEMLVIDPGREIDAYLDLAKKDSLQIKGVFLTHSHADFIAGHMELAEAVSCPIYTSAISGAGYAFQPVQEGDSLKIGKAVLKVIETPGHTPDGLSGAVSGTDNSKEPKLIFTGDVKFVGGMGRPDLIEGTT